MKKKINIASPIIFLVTVLAVLTILTGCGQNKERPPVDALNVLSGAMQCALPEEPFSRPLRIEVLGPREHSLFGGLKEAAPVAGARVIFEPLEDSDLVIEPRTAVSDPGGEVRVTLKAGKKIGDQYVRVIPVDAPDKAKVLRFVTGIKINGARQETLSGEFMPNPIEVRVVDGSGRPAAGLPVYFKVISGPDRKKAVLTTATAVTDKDGIASTQLRMGSKTGIYKIETEVAGDKQQIHIRGIEFEEMGLDLTSLLIAVAGGLALFLFGMKLMSDGLQLVAGDRMKAILAFFTRNRLMAVAAGALVTAVIQSSSATTVMMVGFVNAGLLNLAQSIGIIFGANIGTTITAQMISFNLSWLSLPAIIVGVAMALLCKSLMSRGTGETILGFGFLFFGLSMMGHELKLIGQFPMFIHFFKTFNCAPVNGYMPIGAVLGSVCIGLVVTVIIQSSSAVTGILLALAAGGLIDFYTAFPLILGTNIGTTITAIIASIPANRRAKQAAVAHTLFNVLGSVLMIFLLYIPWKGTDKPFFLYLVNEFTGGDVFAVIPQNLCRHIAMAHTMFNVATVVVFLPFVGIFVRICNFFVPVQNDAQVKITRLEPNLLNTPMVAIEQVISTLRYMLREVWHMIDNTVNNSFLKRKADDEAFVELEKREERIDELQKEITEYLVKLTRRELTPPQSEIIPLLIHCTNDAERIADLSLNIFNLARRLERIGKPMTEEGEEEIKRIFHLLEDQEKNVIAALHNTDSSHIVTALTEERCINKLVNEFERRHIKRLRKGECDAMIGLVFLDMMAEMERIGDNLTNVAERAPAIQKHYFELS
ncbi:MAG: Na/Pi symporter [Victivallales bacterium]|nr:Na/Pi symporter [Victivallales bacterium]